MNDRRMEWSPIHPSAQGSSPAWVLQWVRRSGGSSTSMQDIPVLPAVSCPQCTFTRPRFLLTRSPSRRQQSALPPDNDPPIDWFSHGLLTRFPLLYGWRRGDHSSRIWHSVLVLLSFNFVWACFRNRVWVSLPIPQGIVSKFLLSNLSSFIRWTSFGLRTWVITHFLTDLNGNSRSYSGASHVITMLLTMDARDARI